VVRSGLLLVAGLGMVGCATNIDRRGEQVYRTGSCEALLDMARLYARQGEALEIQGRPGSAGIAFGSAAAFWDALGRPDSARTYHLRSEGALRSDGGRAGLAALRQQGETLQGAGRADSALIVYREVARLAAAWGERVELGRALNNLGVAHHDLENPDSAFHFLRLAADLQDSTSDRAGLAVTENNLGRVYQTLGRPDEAIPHFLTSLELRRALGDLHGEALVLGNIGYSHDLAERPDSALHHHRRSLATVERVCRPSYRGLAQMNVGRAHLALGHLDSARWYLERSLRTKRDVQDERGVGWALDNLGLVDRAEGRYGEAVEHHAAAADLLGRIGDRARSGAALYHLAVAEAARPGDQSLRRASEAFDAASVALAGIRSRAGEDPLRLSFAEQYVDLYSRWALASLARTDLPEEDRAWAGLAAAERGRAQALLDLLADSTREQAPARDLAATGRELAEAVRRTGADGLLYYLVTPDTLLSWLVTPEGHVAVSRAPLPRLELAERVRALRESIELPRGCDFFVEGPAREARDPRVLLAELAELILPPLLRSAVPDGAELLIAPHGPLNLVPFGALEPRGSGRPLGVSHALRYTPSLDLLETGSGGAMARPVSGRALIVAAPEMPRVRVCGEEFTPTMPEGQRRAGERIGALLGATPLQGSDARESYVRTLLPAAGIVHFGTHGFAFATDVDARRSFITLAADPGEPPLPAEGDGMLTVADVLALPRLSAELVVLSACETGLGDLKQAEGTVGLQRAFLSRGARTVLVSLWSVGDLPTAELMESFYEHWLAGASKAEALRRAQEGMWRRDPAPFLWAAFQIVGSA
jgi:tetratricopeptide (TPR) repeat protein